MGKSSRHNAAFNAVLFADVLNRAIGHRSLLSFAQESGISYAHICKYRKAHFNTPPTPNLIERISAVADNGISKDDLYRAAGYDDDSMEKIILDVSEEDRCYEACILLISKVMNSRFSKWTYERDDTLISNHFAFTVNDGKTRKQHFVYIPFPQENVGEKKLKNIITLVYGSLVGQEFGCNDKVTLVTESKLGYDAMLQTPVHYPQNASAMWVNLGNLSVLAEQGIAAKGEEALRE